MITQLRKPKAWAGTLVLAGLGILATATIGHAEDRKSLVEADAVTVSVDDDSFVEQVGFMDDIWNGGSSCDSGGCDI